MTGKRKSSKKGTSSKKDTPEKTRRSSRRKNYKKSESEEDESGSENSNDERETATNDNDQLLDKKDANNDGNKEEESGSSDGAWQVKSENGNKGGIPKLKLCLQRPPEMASPTSETMHSPRPRRSRRTEETVEGTIPFDLTEDKNKDTLENSESESDRRSTRSRRHGDKIQKTQVNENSDCIETVQVDQGVAEEVTVSDSDPNVPSVEVAQLPNRGEESVEKSEKTFEEVNSTQKTEEAEVVLIYKDEANAERDNEDNATIEEDAQSANEVVEAENKTHENESVADRRRKKRSPSRNSSEERAKDAALRSRRPKRKEGSEDGEVVESPEREVIFPSRMGTRIRTVNSTTNEQADKDVSQEVTAGHVRKRRWGSSGSNAAKKPSVSISTAVLKEIIPEAKPVPLSDVQLSPDEDEPEPREHKSRRASKSDDEKIDHQLEKSRALEKRRKSFPSDESEKDYEEEGVESGGEEMIKRSAPTGLLVDKDRDEKKSSVKDGPVLVVRSQSTCADPMAALTKQRSPSPARHPISSILYITNLVRPFTVVQLRDLLARTGSIVPGDGFWIDSIKSRCYVKYSSEEEAKNTRNALHGVRWPASNPKQLFVDFGTDAAMKASMEGVKVPVSNQKEPERRVFDDHRERDRERERDRDVVRDRDSEKRGHDDIRHRHDRAEPKHDDSDRKIRIVDRSKDDTTGRTVRKVTIPVREWDLGKAERGFSPPDPADHRRYGEDVIDDRRKREKDRGRRSPSFEPVRKVKKVEDDGPPKLQLDDLFRKTKATPSIYWLPLTAQQIAVREEMRRKHMENHEKLVAEQKKRQEVKRRHPRSRSRSPKK